MKNTTKAVLLAIVVLSIFIIATASAAKPVYQVKWPAMSTTPGYDVAGSIYGRVTIFNTSTGISNADVWIVNASNTTEYYFKTTSDATGSYSITNVNNTWDGANYLARYTAYCNDSTYGEGYSNNFSVEAGKTAWAAVIINPIPANIKIYAQRTGIVADGAETVKVWAYVTTALNQPVADGTLVNFSINSVKGYGPFDTTNVPGLNGSLGAIGPIEYVQEATHGGYANTTFGWVNETAAGNNSTITAAIWMPYMPEKNDSIKIFFQPTVVSWFGSVVDTFLKGQGGVPVTLHVGNLGGTNGAFVEVYNLTGTTMPDMPYPGAYGFDNIIMWPNITTAYATAEWSIADNVTITGKSNYYSLNKSMTSSGFIMLHVPLPDAITVTANPDIILVGGDTSIITAQLYLNGQKYKRSNVPITFGGTNDSIGYLPTVKVNMSNTEGYATIPLTSGMTKGTVRVYAWSQVTVVNNLTGYADVQVVGWGTISGMVTDKNKNGVPNATVTLWRTTLYDNGTIANKEKYPSPENPQQTVSNPNVAAIGTYTYYRIPSGIYNVTAEKADAAGVNHMWFAIVNLTIGTATNNVAIPDLVVQNIPATVTPTPTPTQVVSVTPTATPVPATSTPTPGFEAVFALAGLLGVAYLLARKEH